MSARSSADPHTIYAIVADMAADYDLATGWLNTNVSCGEEGWPRGRVATFWTCWPFGNESRPRDFKDRLRVGRRGSDWR
jgi:hypothetical protein